MLIIWLSTKNNLSMLSYIGWYQDDNFNWIKKIKFFIFSIQSTTNTILVNIFYQKALWLKFLSKLSSGFKSFSILVCESSYFEYHWLDNNYATTFCFSISKQTLKKYKGKKKWINESNLYICNTFINNLISLSSIKFFVAFSYLFIFI